MKKEGVSASLVRAKAAGAILSATASLSFSLQPEVGVSSALTQRSLYHYREELGSASELRWI